MRICGSLVFVVKEYAVQICFLAKLFWISLILWACLDHLVSYHCLSLLFMKLIVRYSYFYDHLNSCIHLDSGLIPI